MLMWWWSCDDDDDDHDDDDDDHDDDDDDDHDDDDHDDDDDDHDDCKCGATSRFGRTWLNIILQHAQTPAQGQCFEIFQTTNPKP